MHPGLVFTTGKWLVVSTNNTVTLFCAMYLRKGGQFDENMKKYNEDNVNYANSKRRVFKVGIM